MGQTAFEDFIMDNAYIKKKVRKRLYKSNVYVKKVSRGRRQTEPDFNNDEEFEAGLSTSFLLPHPPPQASYVPLEDHHYLRRDRGKAGRPRKRVKGLEEEKEEEDEGVVDMGNEGEEEVGRNEREKEDVMEMVMRNEKEEEVEMKREMEKLDKRDRVDVEKRRRGTKEEEGELRRRLKREKEGGMEEMNEGEMEREIMGESASEGVRERRVKRQDERGNERKLVGENEDNEMTEEEKTKEKREATGGELEGKSEEAGATDRTYREGKTEEEIGQRGVTDTEGERDGRVEGFPLHQGQTVFEFPSHAGIQAVYQLHEENLTKYNQPHPTISGVFLRQVHLTTDPRLTIHSGLFHYSLYSVSVSACHAPITVPFSPHRRKLCSSFSARTSAYTRADGIEEGRGGLGECEGGDDQCQQQGGGSGGKDGDAMGRSHDPEWRCPRLCCQDIGASEYGALCGG
ncbi:hypothetical protein Pcinc_006233 [Petrolisthes cinctipes]|uniref:Uncharacterized protein n=1 Tax=Petrolisthes cinctipes TaxID=88211 RepID=A0AAE1GD83_PETCI|nr:hypothetical protein Pcinc_006233 [Petrolisthes cinctipes]